MIGYDENFILDLDNPDDKLKNVGKIFDLDLIEKTDKGQIDPVTL